jgi:hypothetical protein
MLTHDPFLSLAHSHIIPLADMSLFIISGTSAKFFYSSEAYPTLPLHAVWSSEASLPIICQRVSGSALCNCCYVDRSFTAVVEALVDPLCGEDVVLGKDWIDYCASNNVLPQLELLPVITPVSQSLVTHLYGSHRSVFAIFVTRAIFPSLRFVSSFSCHLVSSLTHKLFSLTAWASA